MASVKKWSFLLYWSPLNKGFFPAYRNGDWINVVLVNCINFSLYFINFSPVLDSIEETRTVLAQNSSSAFAAAPSLMFCNSLWILTGATLWVLPFGGALRLLGMHTALACCIWQSLGPSPVSCQEQLLCWLLLLQGHGSWVMSPGGSTKGLLEPCAAFFPCFHSKLLLTE